VQATRLPLQRLSRQFAFIVWNNHANEPFLRSEAPVSILRLYSPFEPFFIKK